MNSEDRNRLAGNADELAKIIVGKEMVLIYQELDKKLIGLTSEEANKIYDIKENLCDWSYYLRTGKTEYQEMFINLLERIKAEYF